MYKNLLKIIPVMLMTALGIQDAANACTGIRITAKDGSVVYGRTLEYALPLPTDAIFVPEGYKYTGTTKSNTQNGKQWSVKYAFTGVAPIGYDVAIDGVNSKGLAAGIFLFPNYAGYQELTKDNQSQAIAPWELVAYILSQFASIDEVKKGINDVSVVAVPNPIMANQVPPLHYVVHDSQGKSLVIEYINGKLNTYDDPLGVITNSPSFDWHMTNLGNYVNLSVNNVPPVKIEGTDVTSLGQGSGLLGLPGDFTPPSRFIRAVVFSQGEIPAANGQEGVFHAFHILNQFDIPKGSVRGKEGKQNMVEYTQWTSAYDLNSKKFYFKTYRNPQVRMIDLNKMDAQGKKIERFPMSGDNEQPQATQLVPNI